MTFLRALRNSNPRPFDLPPLLRNRRHLAFVVYAAPTENSAFLRLREFNRRQEAVMPFDAQYLQKLIDHLSEALKAIKLAELTKH